MIGALKAMGGESQFRHKKNSLRTATLTLANAEVAEGYSHLREEPDRWC